MRKERIDNLIPIGYNESKRSRMDDRVEIASRKKKKDRTMIAFLRKRLGTLKKDY